MVPEEDQEEAASAVDPAGADLADLRQEEEGVGIVRLRRIEGIGAAVSDVVFPSYQFLQPLLPQLSFYCNQSQGQVVKRSK